MSQRGFREALVTGEVAGVQSADGLQGPEKERERGEERKGRGKKKGVRQRVPTIGLHFSLTPSQKSIERVKSVFNSGIQHLLLYADCEFVVPGVVCRTAHLPRCFLRKRPHPKLKLYKEEKRSIAQLDVWVAASAPEKKKKL